MKKIILMLAAISMAMLMFVTPVMAGENDWDCDYWHCGDDTEFVFVYYPYWYGFGFGYDDLEYCYYEYEGGGEYELECEDLD